ncbi:protein IQ-DOMAIN 1-like [Dorcoceras hygrometricum]|uniref:Protein IQ-DOMAIN 1-like n=1 Tax=Dorcoceras hygrometricum TaxID=472368 RepID=A0A2Z7CWJ9_9LAMI|nr:protein IQ-DOMAIN 1-like [Dorcoceras hygrometricum]
MMNQLVQELRSLLEKKKKIQVISTADESVSSRKDITGSYSDQQMKIQQMRRGARYDSAGRLCVDISAEESVATQRIQTQCLSIQTQEDKSIVEEDSGESFNEPDASNSSIQSRAYLNQLLLLNQSQALHIQSTWFPGAKNFRSSKVQQSCILAAGEEEKDSRRKTLVYVVSHTAAAVCAFVESRSSHSCWLWDWVCTRSCKIKSSSGAFRDLSPVLLESIFLDVQEQRAIAAPKCYQQRAKFRMLFKRALAADILVILIYKRTIKCIGYPRMRASGESSATKHRLLHASGSHPIPPPNDPKVILEIFVILGLEVSADSSSDDVMLYVGIEVADVSSAAARAAASYDDVSGATSFELVATLRFDVAAGIS